MRTGAFEVSEPIPELREPCVLESLQPWIDVNNVATSILREYEIRLKKKEGERMPKLSSEVEEMLWKIEVSHLQMSAPCQEHIKERAGAFLKAPARSCVDEVRRYSFSPCCIRERG
jgi:hypothetical protein